MAIITATSYAAFPILTFGSYLDFLEDWPQLSSVSYADAGHYVKLNLVRFLALSFQFSDQLSSHNFMINNW